MSHVTALEQKDSYLVDDAGALPDESFANAMQRLQIELVSRLDGPAPGATPDLSDLASHRLTASDRDGPP